MNSLILERLSHVHQEYLVFIFGPVHDMVPSHHRISLERSVPLGYKFKRGRLTLEVILD